MNWHNRPRRASVPAKSFLVRTFPVFPRAEEGRGVADGGGAGSDSRREGGRMGNLFFWLGVGAARKGAASKPIELGIVFR